MKAQNKLYLVVSTLVFILFLSYNFAIKNTWLLRKQYLLLNSECATLENTPITLLQLKKKEKKIDSIVRSNHLKGLTAQNNLLYFINDFASKNNLIVLSFNEPHVFKINEQTQRTYQLKVSGSYYELSNLLYTLQSKTSFGEIIHFEFEKIIDIKQKSEHLTLTALLSMITQ